LRHTIYLLFYDKIELVSINLNNLDKDVLDYKRQLIG